MKRPVNIMQPAHPGSQHADRSRAAMTLAEMLMALAVIALMLSGAVGVSEALVNDSADRQTSVSLRSLDRAMMRYQQRHSIWPSSVEPHHIDTPMARCLASLRSSPETDRLVADLPGLSLTSAGFHTVHDGFGRPLVYVDPTDTSPDMARLVARFPRSPDGRPFVVSAGLDGQLGDWSSDDAMERGSTMDNLYSYDPEIRK
jgi:prepilin-type N-terminal cleavage/methylation domain-containing protein